MHSTYTIRRAGSRWLQGAPRHILDCFRNRCGTYTILYTFPRQAEIMGREMDSRPSHPQGVGMSFSLSFREAAAYRYANGKLRIRWDELPEETRKCAIRDGE